MAKIVDLKMDGNGHDVFQKQLDILDIGCLFGQELAQHAAIHAIETLLKYGCTEDNAASMLHGLRLQSGMVSEKIKLRGFVPKFLNETSFN